MSAKCQKRTLRLMRRFGHPNTALGYVGANQRAPPVISIAVFSHRAISGIPSSAFRWRRKRARKHDECDAGAQEIDANEDPERKA